MTLSNRNYHRAQARAAVAPRSQGQFTTTYTPPTVDDNSYYWRDLAARCKARLPQDLPWTELSTHLWPNPEYTPTWRETANAMTLATKAWHNGERTLYGLVNYVKAL